MLVLFTVFLLLVGAPAALLVSGRAISRWTDFEGRRAARPAPPLESGEAWYFHKMRPAFRWTAEGAEQPAPQLAK